MNVTFPDNATIQIFVVPPGAAVPMISTAETPVLLDAPVRRTSRRRDALFLCVGAVLCVGVLAGCPISARIGRYRRRARPRCTSCQRDQPGTFRYPASPAHSSTCRCHSSLGR